MSGKIDPIKLFESVISSDPENYLRGHEAVYQVTESEVREFARQIAAPVVERQPVAYLVNDRFGGKAYLDDESEALAIRRRLGFKDEIPLYTAPPELSELQATIARLTAENERLNGLRPDFPPRPPDGEGLPRYGLRWNGPQQPLAVQMDDGYWTPWHLADQLKAEIERLKGGQGEPVAHTMKTVMQAYEYAQALHLSGTSNFCAVMASHLNKTASQQPPVPAEINQQLIEMRQQFERANFVALGKLLTACLDKVKELNQ